MNIVLLFFYEVILCILAILAIPKTVYSFFVHKKYRKSLLSRFGFQASPFKEFLDSSIWIHAVSVGESKAIASIACELKCRFPDIPLIVSSITETGHAEAKRSLPFADFHIYLPFDFSWIVYPLIKKASPKLILLSESDFWCNFLYFSKKNGASLALVNGKMSEKSMRRFSWVPFFAKPLFGLFDLLAVQNDLYRSRFIGAGAPEEKIKITGNLKLDVEYKQLTSEEIVEWQEKLGLQPDQPVLTIGSTHMPEEQCILHVLKEIWQNTPNLRVILAPRRPESFKEVEKLLDKEKIQWINFTHLNRRTGKEQVILIDAMGLLKVCYQLSDFAIVGGSFTNRVGGHNILEPCGYGKPVLFGPHMHTQLEFVDLVKKYGAGIQVNYRQLKETLENWIESPQEAREIGAQGLLLVNDQKGAVKRTLQEMEPLLQNLQPIEKSL